MSTQQHDPIFESLDQLAGLADTELVGDRMPDIERRVRVARRRKGVGVVAAAAVLAIGGVGGWQLLPGDRAATPPTTPPTTVTPTTTTPDPGAYRTADRLNVDLDGDGTHELVRLLVPKDVGDADQILEVTWGTGETTTATVPNTSEWSLLEPLDLDDDGDLELALLGGGGELGVYAIFQADTDAIEPVSTVDAAGNDRPLLSDDDPTAWQTLVNGGGVFSYRQTEPTRTEDPRPALVREWSLSGATLTQSDENVSECVYFVTNTIGPC